MQYSMRMIKMTLSKKEKLVRELLSVVVDEWWNDNTVMTENDYDNLIQYSEDKAARILSGEEK